jgi:hypothetical protein
MVDENINIFGIFWIFYEPLPYPSKIFFPKIPKNKASRPISPCLSREKDPSF